MYSEHLKIVKDSLAAARSRRQLQQLGENMFELFFDRHPEAMDIFAAFDISKISSLKFVKISDALVDVLEYPNYSITASSEEVYRHQIYGIRDKEYYFSLLDSYVQTIKMALGDEWDELQEECWNDAVNGLKHNVVLGLQEHFG